MEDKRHGRKWASLQQEAQESFLWVGSGHGSEKTHAD